MHAANVEDLPPIRVLSFQLLTEADLLGCHQAQRRVVDSEIAQLRRQAKPGSGEMYLAVGDDLLDVDGWDDPVDRQVEWINGSDAVPMHKP